MELNFSLKSKLRQETFGAKKKCFDDLATFSLSANKAGMKLDDFFEVLKRLETSFANWLRKSFIG
jgi:hypothetical protein